MKILILNPHVDAQHKLVKALQNSGVAVLLTPNVEQAAQVLQFHGSTVDLALVHREGGAGLAMDYGLSLLFKLKADASQADLPVLVTSEQWNDPEFLNHQQTPLGANAYIHWPCDESEILSLISRITGSKLAPGEASITPLRPHPGESAEAAALPQDPVFEMPAPMAASAPAQVEDAAGIFGMNEGSGGIQLEAPEDAGASARPSAAPVIIEPPAEASAQAPIAVPPSPTKAIPVPPPFRGNTQMFQAPAPAPTLAPPPTLAAPSAPTDMGELAFALTPPPSEEAAPSTAFELPAELPSQVSIVKELTNHDHEPKLELPEPSLAPPDAEVPADEPKLEFAPPPAASEASGTRYHLPTVQTPMPENSDPSLDMGSAQDEAALAQELPYLFGSKNDPTRQVPGAGQPGALPSGLPGYSFAHPVGDAVVPGGAAQSPDVETLKKYLMLREQDVAALSAQLRSAQQRIAAQESQLATEQARNAELTAMASDQKRRIESFETEKAMAVESVQAEMNELKFQARAKTDKARLLEIQVRAATEEMEKLKERVRSDIRKIRIREKELENRLEIMRKDSEVLISTRETRIIELKRKLDLMEFNMDLLQNQLAREKDSVSELKKRLTKAAQVVRVAGGLLGSSAGEVLEEISGGLEGVGTKDSDTKTRAS